MNQAKVRTEELRAPVTLTEDSVVYPDQKPVEKSPAQQQGSQQGSGQMQADCGDVLRSWAHR